MSILEKDKLMSLAQEIQSRVFADADQLRHEESMRMAEKQYTAQTNSVLIQQQMLPTSRRKPHNRPRLRRSPIKRSRASDVVRKQKEDRAEKSKTALSFRLIR